MKTTVLENYSENQYSILYINQCDDREFNRGALKNIGFIIAKELWPNHYKNIIFVFNDIDTMPLVNGFINYETKLGVIKHFFGFKFALGGIFSILGDDFEKINGFPNFWAWGYEDNLIQKRALNFKLIIDRSNFEPILSKNIIQLSDGLYRNINRSEYDRYLNNTNEGISDIMNLTYENINGFINVNTFTAGIYNPTKSTVYDLSKGPQPFRKQNKVNMIFH